MPDETPVETPAPGGKSAVICFKQHCDDECEREDFLDTERLIDRAYRYLTEGGTPYELRCLIGDLKDARS